MPNFTSIVEFGAVVDVRVSRRGPTSGVPVGLLIMLLLVARTRLYVGIGTACGCTNYIVNSG